MSGLTLNTFQYSPKPRTCGVGGRVSRCRRGRNQQSSDPACCNTFDCASPIRNDNSSQINDLSRIENVIWVEYALYLAENAYLSLVHDLWKIFLPCMWWPCRSFATEVNEEFGIFAIRCVVRFLELGCTTLCRLPLSGRTKVSGQ